ncbi:SusC/RagA family TonB-linked outer membrane protein [Haliangium ochraceum]|uniref:TonB-dependent receptor n=1 Tax=Haliangium ochraceum (strain DSM 14365 / JCM 11303 / SMP-2) TaxID=502025 RepID=D0LLA5_HALO1|nr:SusC/RagA family TonB-linked outer membrane protein [Haliangium ochraceum]ACY18601.1 TonB-dependent receptor [Haliangium ochraceum DSM 14365]
MLRRTIWVLWLVTSLGLAGGIAHAQERTITGSVEDTATQEPVVGATILVTGTNLGGFTDIDGTFTIDGVPAGEVILAASVSGYQDQSVTVAADQQSVIIEMSLARSEEILITGRAPQITRQNLANGASVVKGDEINEVTSQTLDGALQGRISGANIQANSGAPGGGVQIKLRGVSTVNGEASPLFVIDGVIISNEAIPSGLVAVTESAGGSNASVQDNPVNRIADINPNDIESIEVLKGPAASALYGSKASNGVIVITTKRGRPGETRVSVMQRFGTYVQASKLGSRTFNSLEEAVEVFGDQAADYYQDGRTYDHEELLAGNVGLGSETSASLSGGTEDTTYFASLMARRDPGIIENTGYEKQSMRINLSHKLSDRLRIAATANLVHSDAQRGVTNNDNVGISHYMTLPFTPSFWDPRPNADGSYPANPFIGSGNNPIQTAALMSDSEEVWRLIGSASANYKVWETMAQSFNLGTNLGVDRFQQKNVLVFPTALAFTPPDGSKGIALDASAEARNLNFSVNGVYNLRPAGGGFQAATTVGFQYEDRALDLVYLQGRNLAPGPPAADTGTQSELAVTHERIKDRGVHLQQELSLLEDHLTVLMGFLAEESSVNGDIGRLYVYPKANGAYRLPLPEGISLELLRLRAAYGETGNKPQYGVKFAPLDSTVISGNSGIGIGIDPAGVSGRYGDDTIDPERQREIEAGVDAVAFDGRVVFEASVYQRAIDDLILERQVAPSTGYIEEVINGGSLRNRGIELMLQGTPVKNDLLSWVSRATFSLNRSKVTRLDIPPFDVGGFGTSLGAFRLEEGKSATQIVGNAIDPETGEVIVTKVGDVEPTFIMSFVNTVSFGDFELSTLLDWQQGSDIINLTRFLYDNGQNSVDYVEAGADRFADWAAGNTAAYIEDATFLKLREISLAYTLPSDLASQLGPMKRARVSVSGRNLLTLSNYSGLDPEVSNFGAQTIARNIDVAPYPPSRSFWVSIEAGF